jgi:hypothetical protein
VFDSDIDIKKRFQTNTYDCNHFYPQPHGEMKEINISHKIYADYDIILIKGIPVR